MIPIAAEAKRMTWNGAQRLGLAALLLSLSVACSTDDVVREPALRPVRTQVASYSSRKLHQSLAGVAKPGVESWLSFRIPGSLIDLPADVGASVRKGQVLARIDPTDYEIAVKRAEAGLAQANAASRRAEADYARAKALYENNNASRSELDAARAAAESGLAQVEAVSRELEQAVQQLDYTVLRAPTRGLVAEVNTEVNENISAGQHLILLTAGSHSEVRLVVPERMISQVELGQGAEVVFDALPGRDFSALVSEVGVVSSGSTAYSVTVRLIDPTTEIRAGMAATVRLSLSRSNEEDKLYLRPVAVGADVHGNYVFVVERNGTDRGIVHRRSVDVGRLTPQGIEIVGGLNAGETVVTAGVRRLSEGELVRLPGPQGDSE